MPRALRIEKGGISRWQRKKQQRKKQRRKRGTKPIAVLTAPEFLRGHNPNFNPGGEFIPSRLFCARLAKRMCHAERAERSRRIPWSRVKFCCGIPRLRSE